MAAPQASLLGSGQIAKHVFDEADGAIRIVPSTGTQFDISLSAADGDSVIFVSQQTTGKVSLTSASVGDVVTPFSVFGEQRITLYTNTTSTITDPQGVEVWISPSDTDNVWFDTGNSIAPDATAGVVALTDSSFIARRVKLVMATAITAGTFDLYYIATTI
jgi:hypothetical protein